MSSLDTPEQMASRKNDHIRICAESDVESTPSLPLFSAYELRSTALPECALCDISTQSEFLGQRFSLPLLITGMTGGVEKGEVINEVLSEAASRMRIPMGLGSQKIMLQRKESRKMFDVKARHPKLFVMGNIGASSLNYGVTLSDLQNLVDDLKLDAFALHLNPLQECIQPEGETNFSNLLRNIEKTVRALEVPVLVKEVGMGLDSESMRRLLECGVRAIDVGGLGGTNWSAIEGRRGNLETQRLGELFRHFGVRTDVALVRGAEMKKQTRSNVELVATGGVRDGLQVAKAVALGASMAGVGLPLLRAVLGGRTKEESLENVLREISFFEKSLRIAMLCSGARVLADLKDRIQIKEQL